MRLRVSALSSLSASLRTQTSSGSVTAGGTSSASLPRSLSRGGRCTCGCMTSARSGSGCSPTTSALPTPTNPKVGGASPESRCDVWSPDGNWDPERCVPQDGRLSWRSWTQWPSRLGTSAAARRSLEPPAVRHRPPRQLLPPSSEFLMTRCQIYHFTLIADRFSDRFEHFPLIKMLIGLSEEVLIWMATRGSFYSEVLIRSVTVINTAGW